jgi:hypothetical protein
MLHLPGVPGLEHPRLVAQLSPASLAALEQIQQDIECRTAEIHRLVALMPDPGRLDWALAAIDALQSIRLSPREMRLGDWYCSIKRKLLLQLSRLRDLLSVVIVHVNALQEPRPRPFSVPEWVVSNEQTIRLCRVPRGPSGGPSVSTEGLPTAA